MPRGAEHAQDANIFRLLAKTRQRQLLDGVGDHRGDEREEADDWREPGDPAGEEPERDRPARAGRTGASRDVVLGSPVHDDPLPLRPAVIFGAPGVVELAWLVLDCLKRKNNVSAQRRTRRCRCRRTPTSP